MLRNKFLVIMSLSAAAMLSACSEAYKGTYLPLSANPEIHTGASVTVLPFIAEYADSDCFLELDYSENLEEWVTEDLAASGYFKRLKKADWKDLAERKVKSDVIVYGVIHGRTATRNTYFWAYLMFPLLFGAPDQHFTYHMDFTVYAADVSAPNKPLLERHIAIDFDKSTNLLGNASDYGCYVVPMQEVQKLLPQELSKFREDLARAVMPGGKLRDHSFSEAR